MWARLALRFEGYAAEVALQLQARTGLSPAKAARGTINGPKSGLQLRLMTNNILEIKGIDPFILGMSRRLSSLQFGQDVVGVSNTTRMEDITYNLFDIFEANCLWYMTRARKSSIDSNTLLFRKPTTTLVSLCREFPDCWRIYTATIHRQPLYFICAESGPALPSLPQGVYIYQMLI